MWSTVSYCKWTKGLIGKLIWKLNLPNSNMTRHLFINRKVLIVQRFLLEFTGGRKVLTIQEFSSDDLMDTRDPPFSSHIFYIKSKIIKINLRAICIIKTITHNSFVVNFLDHTWCVEWILGSCINESIQHEWHRRKACTRSIVLAHEWWSKERLDILSIWSCYGQSIFIEKLHENMKHLDTDCQKLYEIKEGTGFHCALCGKH